MDHQSPYLTTGGDNDPFLPHLIKAILRSKKIDFAIAFIQLSGLRKIKSALTDALERGAKLRILTGDYLDITDPRALDMLMGLVEIHKSVELRMFECGGTVSFHPKVYLFQDQSKDSDSGEIFIGSSNISESALTVGIEWNLRILRNEDQQRFDEICDRFNTLFSHPNTISLDRQWVETYRQRREVEPNNHEKQIESDHPNPTPLQSKALKALVESRNRGEQRGLVVLATGLGKTWLAGFDVQQFDANRVLFVAHREEILLQAMLTFQKIMPQRSCGLHMGSQRDTKTDILFASVQSIGRQSHLDQFKTNDFDYIVIDEFHHASSNMYQRILHYFYPKYLLGLTATPDRSDGKDILAICHGNLIYECKLSLGIEENYLCPFDYYGILDQEVDYVSIPWRNGKFDEGELEKMVTTRRRTDHVLKEWNQKGGYKTLAFCVSRRHADFMAESFLEKGISSVSVHSTSDISRREAIDGLREGGYQVVFSVDLFNEGFDLPSIDTVMMLRPTESSILFLQQLGRGLRKSPNKTTLKVLDFIGNHHSFLNRPRLLLETGQNIDELFESLLRLRKGLKPNGLPEGCQINYDLEVINFFDKLLASKGDQAKVIYQRFKTMHGRKPTLLEMFQHGADIPDLTRRHNHWFAFVEHMKDLDDEQRSVIKEMASLLKEIQKTSLTKCFKLVLLQALINNGGLLKSLPVDQLAMFSWGIFESHPAWKHDLPDHLRDRKHWKNDNSWIQYWKKNPVKAWSSGNFFDIDPEQRFILCQKLNEEHCDALEYMMREIIDYRQEQYWQRGVAQSIKPIPETQAVSQASEQQ